MNLTASQGARIGRAMGQAARLSRAAVMVGGVLTLASAVLIGFDVLARKFLGFNTGGADELSGYAFAISTSWALAYTVLERVNVRVDFLYLHLPVRLAAVLDWLALVSLAVFMALLTWYAWDVAATSWLQGSTANTPLGTPLWWPQGLWLLGLLWMCAVLALMLLRAGTALLTGDLATVQALCGVRSSQQEAQEEAEAGQRLVHEGAPA
jgi:TRAP-type C4-dicarboxylate transport system permease small subunit